MAHGATLGALWGLEFNRRRDPTGIDSCRLGGDARRAEGPSERRGHPSSTRAFTGKVSPVLAERVRARWPDQTWRALW